MLGNLISMALGVASVTREKVDDLTNLLVEKGEMQREEARKVAEKLVEKGQEERGNYLDKLEENIESLKSRLVTREDIEKLEEKVEELSHKIKNM